MVSVVPIRSSRKLSLFVTTLVLVFLENTRTMIVIGFQGITTYSTTLSTKSGVSQNNRCQQYPRTNKIVRSMILSGFEYMPENYPVSGESPIHPAKSFKFSNDIILNYLHRDGKSQQHYPNHHHHHPNETTTNTDAASGEVINDDVQYTWHTRPPVDERTNETTTPKLWTFHSSKINQ